MEDFNLELTMDEAAEARIAHAEFLEKIKEWGMETGTICTPFGEMAENIVENGFELDESTTKAILMAIPLGVRLLIDQMNDFYELMQYEAVKVLGAPFHLHDKHHDKCGEIEGVCGHQDHYTNLPEEK